MKPYKLEVNAMDAVTLYRALGREEEAARADPEMTPAIKAMTVAHINDLKDRVAIAYEKTRVIPKTKKEKT